MTATHPEIRKPLPLVDALWRTLAAARGNPLIRERLVQLVGDSVRLEALVRQIGPTHAAVRDLLDMARASGEGRGDRVLVAREA